MRIPRWFRNLLPVIACLVLTVAGPLPAVPHAAAAACATSQPDEDQRASQVLAEERPFAPRNEDLFFTFANPAWADAAPLEVLDGPALDEWATRESLQIFLEKRFPCAPDRVQEGLATFGDPVAREKVPEPTLRAALAALTGTLGEPAIEFLLYRTPVTLVTFGIYVNPATGFPGQIAGAFVSPDGTRSIVIDRRHRYLPFGAFSALLVHEILHTGSDDDNAGQPEEVIAGAVEALVYMEMLLTDPTLAALPDEITRSNSNHLALLRLNSGPADSAQLTLLVPESEANIDPLATQPVTGFYEYYANYVSSRDRDFRERETTGHHLLDEILIGLVGPDGPTPERGADFDAATVAVVDQHQAVLSPAELVQVACILELDVPCD